MEAIFATETILMLVSAVAGIATVLLALILRGQRKDMSSRSRLVEQVTTQRGYKGYWWTWLAFVLGFIGLVLTVISFFLQRR